jgi:transposase
MGTQSMAFLDCSGPPQITHASIPVCLVPPETGRVATAALSKSKLHKAEGPSRNCVRGPGFCVSISEQGQPAFAPWRLALVTVMQFAEGLSDRDAFDAVRTRIDLKYLMG